MAYSSGKTKAMEEDKSRKNIRVLESRLADGSKLENHVRSSARASVTEKNSLTKMNSLKKRHVQTHYFDFEVNEDCVTFIDSNGGIKIK